MPYIYLILGAIFSFNIYVFISRRKHAKKAVQKAARDRIEAERHLELLKLKLTHEQEKAAKQVELRNKMIERLEQAKLQASETGSDPADESRLDSTDSISDT